MVKNIMDPKYSPASFVNSNLAMLLPGNQFEVTSVDFSGIKKKPFQSGNRPVGTIFITCRDDNEKYYKRRIFMKFHDNAWYAFQMMQKIHRMLENRGLESYMPVPLGCDRDNNVFYQEYVEGTALKYHVAWRLGMNNRKKINETSGLIYKIGEWLSEYHAALEQKEKASLADLTANTRSVLTEGTMFFSSQENSHLLKLLDNFELDYRQFSINLTKPHNDFSLRNIIVGNNNDFKVIDWDAMVHEDFPEKAPVWNDITCFYLNLHSLIRFYPLVDYGNIDKLSQAFISGYFRTDERLKKADIQKFIWFFSLSYFIGLIGDRALPFIYRTRLNRRFLKNLKRALLSGTGP